MNIRRFFLQFLPRYAVGRMVIYAKLMRIDKPIGTLLLLWPTYWALWIASKGVPDADIFIAFTAGTFLMRSAGCVVNDFADRNFDGAVERTKNRPFAKGLVSKTEALLLTVMLCLMAALCLVSLNRFTWLMSLPALFLAVTYPFTKRFFPLPQFYLGLAFSFGIPMAFAAVQDRVPPEAWLMFTANALWTLAYDTIYAMADKESRYYRLYALPFLVYRIDGGIGYQNRRNLALLAGIAGNRLLAVSAVCRHPYARPPVVFPNVFGQQPHRFGVVLRIGLPLFLVVFGLQTVLKKLG